MGRRTRIAKDRAVLAIDMDYFLLTGGLSRWLYRIARKHCGNNERWTIPVNLLHEKSGSRRNIRFFKRDLKDIVKEDGLPGYHIKWYHNGTEERIEFSLKNETLFKRRMIKAAKKAIFGGKPVEKSVEK